MSNKKLTATDIYDIRSETLKRHISDTALAEILGTSRKTIYNVRTGRYYRDVPAPKTLNQFPQYEIYPDGRVLSKTTGLYVGRRGTSVRIHNRNSERVRVPVKTLVQKAFGTVTA